METTQIESTLIFILSEYFVDHKENREIENIIKKKSGSVSGCIVDFSCVPMVNSMGVGNVISLIRIAKEAKISIVFCSVRKTLLGIFKTSELHRIVEIFDDKEKALISLSE